MFQRNILSELIKISHEAGIIIMDIYRNKFEVNHKNDNSPVTNADRNAEDFILKKLKKFFPIFQSFQKRPTQTNLFQIMIKNFFLLILWMEQKSLSKKMVNLL